MILQVVDVTVKVTDTTLVDEGIRAVNLGRGWLAAIPPAAGQPSDQRSNRPPEHHEEADHEGTSRPHGRRTDPAGHAEGQQNGGGTAHRAHLPAGSQATSKVAARTSNLYTLLAEQQGGQDETCPLHGCGL